MAKKPQAAPKSKPKNDDRVNLKKIARNEANLKRHEANIKFAKAYGIPIKKGFRKECTKIRKFLIHDLKVQKESLKPHGKLIAGDSITVAQFFSMVDDSAKR